MNNRILIFGDSITWGAWDSKSGWATRLKNYTDNQAIKSTSDTYDTVYPLGISGDNTDKFLKRFETELVNRIDEDSNTVVVIALGINDSQFAISNNENRVPIEDFKKNLDEVFKILNKHKIKDIIFIGLTPVADELLNPMPWKPTHGYSNENVQKYDAVLKQTAQENNSTYIELYEKFMNSDNYKKLLSDGLHPNTEGHELVYNLILSKLNLLSLLD